MESHFLQIKKILHETLNDTKFVTLTVDGWFDRRSRSFIGVICHFINDKYEPQTFLIDFVRSQGSHTGENIHRTTVFILDRYNIKEKVFKIVTDNASSIIKAYKIGLSVDDDMNDDYDEKEKLNPNNNFVFDDNDYDFNIDQLKFMNVSFTDNYEDTENPSSLCLSYFIHSLQLSIGDGLKNSPHAPKLLKTYQSLAKSSHKSSKTAEKLEELNKNINKMTITRWNSEFLLIKSILSIDKTDLESIICLMENPIKFSENDIIVLEELIDILQPFYDISIKCQAETAITISLVVPSIVHLISHLRDVKQDTSLCLKLVQQLEQSIRKCFSGIINRLNLVDVTDDSPYADPVCLMAAVLDPQFKILWIHDLKLHVNSENQLKQYVIELIINDMKKDSAAEIRGSMKIDSYLTSLALFSAFSYTTTAQKKTSKAV